MSTLTAPAVTGHPAIRPITQYSRPAIVGIWAAAAVPMGVGAWIVAPALGSSSPGGAITASFARALLGTLAAGLVWQFVLVLILVGIEQRSLRWSRLRPALWLTAPTNAAGRRGGRLWLWAAAVTVAFGLTEGLIDLKPPATRDFGRFLGTDEGHSLLRGNVGLLALIIAIAVFNTVLGEELLFRGLLLPRMRASFGRGDWFANAALFGLYHLHQPWSMPTAFIGGLAMAYATRRFRSAWMGIIAHSAQSVVLIGLTVAVFIS
jgi:uncharacterized protein